MRATALGGLEMRQCAPSRVGRLLDRPPAHPLRAAVGRQRPGATPGSQATRRVITRVMAAGASFIVASGKALARAAPALTER